MRAYTGGASEHGTTTVVLEPDPNWTGFDPVPQLCVWRPVKDYVWPHRTSSLRSRSTGAGGHGKKGGGRKPSYVHRPGETVVRRFGSINAALVFMERGESGKLRGKLTDGKVHTWDTGVRQWLDGTAWPEDLVGVPIVEHTRQGK